MPRITPAVQKATTAGIVPTFSAPDAAGISVMRANGRTLHVKTSGTALTLTVPTPGSVDGSLAISDRTISMAATEHRVIGFPLNVADYDQSDGFVYIDFSVITGCTVAVIDPA